MNRLMTILAAGVACTLCGCAGAGKSPATAPAGGSADMDATKTPSVESLRGRWEGYGDDSAGTTIAFNPDGTFTSHVHTNWKDPAELDVAGHWRLQDHQLYLTISYGQMIPIIQPLMGGKPPSAAERAEVDGITVTENDLILFVKDKMFKTLDQDGQTRTYQRVE